MLSCWKALLTPATHTQTKKRIVKPRYLIGAFKVLQGLIVLHAVLSLLWYKQYQNKDEGVGSVKVTLKGKGGNRFQYYDHTKYAQDLQHVQREGREGNSYCRDYGLCDIVKDSSFTSTNNLTQAVRIADLAREMNETILHVSSQVWFRKFNIRRKNPGNGSTNCTYNNDKNCPSLALSDIIHHCGDNISSIVGSTAVYGITVHWNCNIDSNIHECQPYHTIKRIKENASKGESGTESKWISRTISRLTSGSGTGSVTGRGMNALGSVHVLGVRVLVFMDAKCGKFAVERVMACLGVLLVRVMVFRCVRRAVFMLVMKKKVQEGEEALFQLDQDEDEFDM